MLRQASEHFLLTLDEQKTSEAKLQRVVDLGTDELKEVSRSACTSDVTAQRDQPVRALSCAAVTTEQEMELVTQQLMRVF